MKVQYHLMVFSLPVAAQVLGSSGSSARSTPKRISFADLPEPYGSERGVGGFGRRDPPPRRRHPRCYRRACSFTGEHHRLMHTRGVSATPPCPTISVFSFPGTSLPSFSRYSRRCGRLTFLVLPQLPAFTAGIVILLNIWGAKRSGGVAEPAKEMEDVHNAWPSCGCFPPAPG